MPSNVKPMNAAPNAKTSKAAKMPLLIAINKNNIKKGKITISHPMYFFI